MGPQRPAFLVHELVNPDAVSILVARQLLVGDDDIKKFFWARTDGR